MSEVIKRIKNDGDVEIKGEIIEEMPAFEDTQKVDDSHGIDDSIEIDDSKGLEYLFEVLLSTQSQFVPVDKIFIDIEGNIYASEFIEESDSIRLRDDSVYEFAGEIKEGEI